MAKENTQLINILEREFQRLRELKDDPAWCKTYGEMARVLGIPASTLSHYRAGNRFPNLSNAQDITNILQSEENGGTEETRKALAEELLAARPIRTDNQVHAQDWMRSIGREGHLLLVEFRDFPSARPSNPNKEVSREMAKEAGRAVAKGLAYALLNPYSSSSRTGTNLVSLKNYLNSLDEAIRDTYERILGEAYRQVFLDHQEGEKQEVALNRVRRLLRVYQWADPQVATNGGLDSCPGIGYKLFYHLEGLETPELWHWLSTPNGEMLILKTQNESELNAVESRFYPILDFFEVNNCLPATTQEMEHFAQRDLKTSLWVEVESITPDKDQSLREKAKERAS